MAGQSAQPGDVDAAYKAILNPNPLTLSAFLPLAYSYPTSGLDLPQLSFDTITRSSPTINFNNVFFVFANTNYNGLLLQATYTRSYPVVNAAGVNTFQQALFAVTVPCLRAGPKSANPSQYFTNTSATDPSLITFTPSSDGTLYGVGFRDVTPQAAYQDYANYVKGNGPAQLYTGSRTPTGAQYRDDIAGCAAQTSGNPLVGNPQSLQFSLIDAALDPGALGSVFDDGGAGGAGGGDQPSNLVGVQYGRTSLAGSDGNKVDASYQRAFRIIPGSRALLVVALPFTFYDVRGGQQFRGVGSLALQYPVTRNWVVEPKIAYGGITADDQGISGQSVSASVTSQYAIYNHWLGRGRLTLGNMLGYTQVTDQRLGGGSVSRHPGNVITRDGLAYEYPLKAQFDGRVASLRASYTYTYVDGSKLFLNQTHDVSLSIGVRSRETTLKNSYEILRIGLRGELGDKYNAVYLFGGYRF